MLLLICPGVGKTNALCQRWKESSVLLPGVVGSGRVDSYGCIAMGELLPLSLDIDMLLLICLAGAGKTMVICEGGIWLL